MLRYYLLPRLQGYPEYIVVVLSLAPFCATNSPKPTCGCAQTRLKEIRKSTFISIDVRTPATTLVTTRQAGTEI